MDSLCAELARAHSARAWLPRWSTVGIAIALSLGSTAVFTVTGEALGHFFCVVLAGIATAGLWLVLGLLAVALQLSRRARAQAVASALSRFCVLLSWMLLVQVPALMATEYVRNDKVESAMRWCEATAVRLDEWHANHGRYPAEIAELVSESERPYFCRGGGLIYRGDEDEFTLDFGDGGWVSGWAYHSRDRKWSYYD